jgi:arylsulfatase A-like enzyme
MVWTHVAAAQERPNIVLIVADDIGYSDFGAFGGEIETPNIDALAAQGVRFSNFHVASSCAPTRAMLLTGVDSHGAGVGSMRELMPLSHRGKPGYDGVLNDRVQTIANLLQAAGYRTSIAGKWHLGMEANNLPPARGFDYSVIQADSGSDNFEMRPYLPMQQEVFWYENGQRLSTLPDDFYSSRFFVDKTIEFLKSSASEGKPFFAYVAFQANHTPVQAPAEFIDPYRGRYTQGWAQIREARIKKIREYGLLGDQAVPAAGPSQADWDALTTQQQYFEARRMQVYAGMATAMDHEIGRLVTWLRETGQYDNTVFVLFSDNGATIADAYENPYGRRWIDKNYLRDVETLGEKGSWVAAGSGWGHVSNTPFDGYKFYAGEGGVRVPLIISGLPSIDPGSVDRDFVYVTDLAPALLEIAGLDRPQAGEDREPMTGQSLVPLFEAGSGAPHSPDEAIGYEFSGNSAVYRGDYKLIRNQPPVGDRQWRLYNIGEDPGETTDLSERLPDLYQELQTEYESYVSKMQVLPMPENYSLATQVMINTMLFVYLPKYLPYIGGFLVLAVASYIYYRRRRVGRQ